ncbi:MAG: flippase-like domain-containing protein [Deltaproteobacteria bacterium]|nr:flippase-like domain-containing protein [Deltaproteobacteria bacterium]
MPKWARLALGLALLALVLWRLDLTLLLERVRQAAAVPLGLAAAWTFLEYLVMSLLTCYLVSTLPFALSFRQALRLNTASVSLGFLLPSRLGHLAGRPVLYQYSLAPPPGLARAGGLVLAELVPDALRQTLLGLAVLVAYHSLLPSAALALLVPSAAVYCLGSLILVLGVSRPTLLAWGLALVNRLARLCRLDRLDLARRLLAKGAEVLELVQGGAASVVGQRRHFTLYALLAMAKAVLFQSFRLHLVLSALGATLPWHLLILLPSVIYSVQILPFTVSGLGLAEVSGTLVLGSLGLSPETAFAAIFLDRVLSFYLPVACGAPLLSSYLRRVKK